MNKASWTSCLVLLVLSAGVPAHVKDNPLFDQYGNITFEAEKARLDNYAIQIKNAPGSRGFIVVYSGGRWTSSYVRWRARRAVKYLVQKQGVSADRISWRHDARCGGGSVLLYLFFPGEADPARDSKCFRGSHERTLTVHNTVSASLG
jgi:hypothetical protein